MDVKYITVKSSKLATVPVADGQIIAISDKDAWFYDMEGTRRPVSGQSVATSLPEDTDRLYPNTLFIVSEGEDRGIHWWDGTSFNLISNLNTDENVTSEVVALGKIFLVGSDQSKTSTGKLKKHAEVYLDLATGKIYAKGFAGGVADKATEAENADKASKAEADAKGQNIADTYIKEIKSEGTTVTVTYGSGQTKEFHTQDTNTHAMTHVVFTDDAESDENLVAANGEVHMNVFDDNTLRSSHKITGSGSVEVTSDAEGNLDIKGTAEWKPNTYKQDGYVKAGQPNKVWSTDESGNPDWREAQGYTHPKSGVIPGTYTSVEVNDEGHVTSGSNPTKLAEYGITDAVPFIVLDNDVNLNNIQQPGFYIALPSNAITNKPFNVDSFGMIVVPTSEGSYLTQKVFGSGKASDGSVIDVNQYSRYCRNNSFSAWTIDQLTDTVYTHPSDPGYLHIPSGGSPGQVLVWSADGEAAWGDAGSASVEVMTGSTLESDGEAGLVPAPDAGPPEAFLRNDGNWAVPKDTKYKDMVGTDGTSDGQSGLVPAPSAKDSDKYLCSDGTWKVIQTTSAPAWEEFIP